MKKSELKELIKNGIVAELSSSEASKTADELERATSAAKELKNTLSEEDELNKFISNEYDKLIGGIISRSVDMKKYVTKTGDERALELFKKYKSHLMAFDEYMAYGSEETKPADIPGFEGTMDALDSLSIREDEDEDASDSEIKSQKASELSLEDNLKNILDDKAVLFQQYKDKAIDVTTYVKERKRLDAKEKKINFLLTDTDSE